MELEIVLGREDDLRNSISKNKLQTVMGSS